MPDAPQGPLEPRWWDGGPLLMGRVGRIEAPQPTQGLWEKNVECIWCVRLVQRLNLNSVEGEESLDSLPRILNTEL